MKANFETVSPLILSELEIDKRMLKSCNVNKDLTLQGVSEKSYAIKQNFAFCALSGFETHGANFIKEAVSRGASLVITDAEGEMIIEKIGVNLPTYVFKEPREIFATMAAAFFKEQPKTIVGITGTNGKTSVAHYVRQLWQILGEESVSIGTTGVEGSVNLSLKNTTPDPVEMHWLFQRLK